MKKKKIQVIEYKANSTLLTYLKVSTGTLVEKFWKKLVFDIMLGKGSCK